MKTSSQKYFLFAPLGLLVQINSGQSQSLSSPTNSSAGTAEFNADSPTKYSGGETNSVGVSDLSGTGMSSVPPDLRPFQFVLPQGHLLDNWLGIRRKLEDQGFNPTVTFVSDVAGNPIGGKSQGISHADNLGINLAFDLDKLAGLQGGSFLVSMSQRDGNSLSHDRIGNVFTVQQVYGGQTFHLIDIAYQQKLLDDRFEFQVGRIAAGDDFLVIPGDSLFMQNAFDGNPVGIFLIPLA